MMKLWVKIFVIFWTKKVKYLLQIGIFVDKKEKKYPIGITGVNQTAQRCGLQASPSTPLWFPEKFITTKLSQAVLLYPAAEVPVFDV